jgi:hypothetical protein
MLWFAKVFGLLKEERMSEREGEQTVMYIRKSVGNTTLVSALANVSISGKAKFNLDKSSSFMIRPESFYRFLTYIGE